MTDPSEPYVPDRNYKTADEMANMEAQALRLACMLLDKLGGSVTLTQEYIDDIAERAPVLKTYLDPFANEGRGGFVYELQTKEEMMSDEDV